MTQGKNEQNQEKLSVPHDRPLKRTQIIVLEMPEAKQWGGATGIP
jgi:hypothetical protein